VNIQDNYSYTRLHEAAKNAHLDIVKILLEKDRDINARNKEDQMPLELVQAEEIRSILQKARRDGKEMGSESCRYREAERRKKNVSDFSKSKEGARRFHE
jgi:flagellar biosynthesis/type III secretory pathway protein FliH